MWLLCVKSDNITEIYVTSFQGKVLNCILYNNIFALFIINKK